MALFKTVEATCPACKQLGVGAQMVDEHGTRARQAAIRNLSKLHTCNVEPELTEDIK